MFPFPRECLIYRSLNTFKPSSPFWAKRAERDYWSWKICRDKMNLTLQHRDEDFVLRSWNLSHRLQRARISRKRPFMGMIRFCLSSEGGSLEINLFVICSNSNSWLECSGYWYLPEMVLTCTCVCRVWWYLWNVCQIGASTMTAIFGTGCPAGRPESLLLKTGRLGRGHRSRFHYREIKVILNLV